MNGSSAVVLSGERVAVQEAVGRLAGRRVHWLEVSHAFHSPLMRPVADGLARAQKISGIIRRKVVGISLGHSSYRCRTGGRQG